VITSSSALYLHGEVGFPLNHWRRLLLTGYSLDIDLTSLILTLDNTASEIVTYQRDSTVQRKDLAQKTKDFRKLEDSAKLGEIKGLLKGLEDSRWSTNKPS
jgi:hypothetical protein